MIELEQYISIKQSLSILGNQVKRGTLYNWLYQNKISHLKLGGKVLVHKQSLLDFINSAS